MDLGVTIFVGVLLSPFIGFSLGLLTLIVNKLIFKKEIIGNIAVCLILWSTFSIFMPSKAEKYGLLKKLYGWIITLLSPAAIFTYAAMYFLCTFNSPLPYDKLHVFSNHELTAMMETDYFPEFEYEDNVHDSWNGETVVRYKFKNENDTQRLFDILDKKRNGSDNIYICKRHVAEEDRDYFGCDSVYVYQRGFFDNINPTTKIVERDQSSILIAIGRKRFTVKEGYCYLFYIEDYANPDSLRQLTGVRFPEYKFVNCDFEDYFEDKAWGATIKLKDKPSKQFIRSIENAENWQKNEDGTYIFQLMDRKGDLFEAITVDPNSQYVNISVSTL